MTSDPSSPADHPLLQRLEKQLFKPEKRLAPLSEGLHIDLVFSERENEGDKLQESGFQATLKSAERSLPREIPKAAPLACFGLRQSFQLNHLAFPKASHESQRLFVSSLQFIAAETLESWLHEPPKEAIPLPKDCDGLMDGLHPEGAMVFYALLEKSSPSDTCWRLLPLRPSHPPFQDVSHFFLLGQPRKRLEEALSHAPTQALKELLSSALQALPKETP